jgi:FG-GAP-like repeat
MNRRKEMDRRSFGKLLAGTVTAAGMSQVSAAEQNMAEVAKGKATLLSKESSVTDIPPSGGGDAWELVILDAEPPHETETNSAAAADIDGDGRTELIIGGNGALLWYRPSTSEKGVVAQGHFSVGVALLDIDHDGRMEIIVGKEKGIRSSPQDFEKWDLCWYKSGASLHDSWTEHIADDRTAGQPHDAIFSDLDGDGKQELVVNAMYSDTPGLYAYKIPADPTRPWKKQMIQSGLVAEGTRAGDLDGDGKAEIVSGPYWYSAPRAGAFSGQEWKTHSLAQGFRELCRAAIIDVNGDGRLDVVLVEDEYPDGRLSWFENRLESDPEHPWIEHPIDAPLNWPHSLRAWQDAKTKQVHVLAGEMNAGGWSASYNWQARLIEFTSLDGGKSWRSELLYEGEGTHEAVRVDLDGSGTNVIFGHAAQVRNDPGTFTGWVQMFRPREKPSVLTQYKHMFIDREKPYTGIDMHGADVDGDGKPDIVCGAWWYKNPTWERRTIPGVAQIINAYDIDKDGKMELIGIKPKAGADPKSFYSALCSDLVWLKPTDPSKDLWEEHLIGTGDGDWPHGNAIAPLLPGGRVALVCGYHNHANNPPQIFEAPDDLKQPWKKSVIANIQYGEEMIAYDLDGDGKLDIVAGPHWLENLGDGRFEPHLLIDPELLKSAHLDMISRTAIMDVNGDGRPDILFTVEAVDYSVRKAYFRPVGWMENTGSPRDKKFEVHLIDQIRSPHSIGVGDLDGDGELEVVAGEHDPFTPYRSQSRLYAYKKADPKGITWSRFPIDNRFSNHDGAKVVELSPGKLVILSHSWMEPTYVHIWERL